MIKRRNTNAEVSTQGLGYAHEQSYGLITSLSTHLIVFILFFALSIHKSSNDVKTFYIQFTQMGEQTVQSPQPAREMKRPKVAEPERKVVREETPVIKEPPVKEHEAVIRTDAIESHEAVNVASTSEPMPPPQATHQQGGESTGSDVSYTASSSNTSSGIETEFGTKGAPAFLKRQMPVYPMMAKKLGKQGKVVLRLFINEKGRFLNVEVVEPAGYGFTESAVEAVKMSTFSPAHENGVRIASKALLTIRFVLKRI
jgi:TonB family protein